MSGDAEYGLVVPFLPVESRGGPFDDAAYTAGYEMGRLDEELSGCRGCMTSGEFTIRRENAEQADLIAMRHGYRSTVRPLDYGWVQLSIHTTES